MPGLYETAVIDGNSMLLHKKKTIVVALKMRSTGRQNRKDRCVEGEKRRKYEVNDWQYAKPMMPRKGNNKTR